MSWGCDSEHTGITVLPDRYQEKHHWFTSSHPLPPPCYWKISFNFCPYFQLHPLPYHLWIDWEFFRVLNNMTWETPCVFLQESLLLRADDQWHLQVSSLLRVPFDHNPNALFTMPSFGPLNFSSLPNVLRTPHYPQLILALIHWCWLNKEKHTPQAAGWWTSARACRCGWARGQADGGNQSISLSPSLC